MIKKFLTMAMFLAVATCYSSCGETPDTGDGEGTEQTDPDPDPDPEEEEEPEPEVVKEKDKIIWIDASANISRFSRQSNINYYLQMAKDAGFNQIVIDVKSCQGEALYKSDILPRVKILGDFEITFDWDYLEVFIQKARALDLGVIVSTTFFPGGDIKRQQGLVYGDSRWDGKTCMQYTPDGMIDIRDDKTKVAAFLNPVLPEVQDFLLSMVEEIVTKYDIDGYALDYCRYCDGEGDFSEATRVEFEKYLGTKVANFPEDIFTYDENGARQAGIYYKQWWAFRAGVVADFIGKVKDKIHSIKPEVKVHYWAGSWWQAIYQNGQNWGSADYDYMSIYSGYNWCSPEYGKQGFAKNIDVFQLGAYLSTVYGYADANSIEYAINRAKRMIGDDCALYGTFSTTGGVDVEAATHLCMTQTEGIMVFDMVHVINGKFWDEIKAGIDRAEEELGTVKE